MLKINDLRFLCSLTVEAFPDRPYQDYLCLISVGDPDCLYTKFGLNEESIDKLIDCLTRIRKEASKTSDAAKSVDVDKRGS